MGWSIGIRVDDGEGTLAGYDALTQDGYGEHRPINRHNILGDGKFRRNQSHMRGYPLSLPRPLCWTIRQDHSPRKGTRLRASNNSHLFSFKTEMKTIPMLLSSSDCLDTSRRELRSSESLWSACYVSQIEKGEFTHTTGTPFGHHWN